MADSNNPGQFGNRDDTTEQASKGGQSQDTDNSTNLGEDMQDMQE